jgi:diguanylate cyclase (GGDEF)-like protein
MLLHIDAQIGKLNKITLFCIAFIIAISIAICDNEISADISFYVLYAIPIFIGAWFIGVWAGITVSFVSSLAWAWVDFKNSESIAIILFIDTALRLIFFTMMSLVISSLHDSFEREKESAHTDFLTGLPNRRTFLERISTEIARSKRYNRPLTIAYIDLDNFKTLNDRYGHAVGDDALRRIASTLRQSIRASDCVARMGGDEFLLYLPETNDTQAMSSLTHLQDTLNEVSESQKLPITYTIGAVTYDIPNCSPEEMIKTADRIMYSAKNEGKNMIKHMNVLKVPVQIKADNLSEN